MQLRIEDIQQIKSNIIRMFIIGLSITLIVLIVDFFVRDVPFSLNGFFYLYKLSPIHWILLTLPVLLVVLTYLFSKPLLDQIKSNEEEIIHQQEKAGKINDFTKKLINDDINAEYELVDENDEAGKSLIELKETLSNNKKKDLERRKEDEQRNWSAEGLAKFADILRQDNNNLENLSYNIISNLVSYLGANQGGFFILHDDEGEKYFELTGCYAYERKKYTDKKTLWGEGLIGSVALEGKTSYLENIPNSYLDITSGLGKANPKCLLIVPLIINEEVHGVIEVASFSQIERYHIDFVEKLAESIASSISTAKINVKTNSLLHESREQAEILAAQEEQMRQNMEELQATQEEAARQAEKFISFTNSVNHTLIRAEYDTDGTLLYANTKFLKKLGYSANSEVEGQHISLFINTKEKDWFFKIWETLASGGRHFEGYMKHMTKTGMDLWTMATYTCVRKEDGSVEKILFLAIDTTEQKKESLNFEGQIKALNRSSIKIDFGKEGNIIDVNNNFLDAIRSNPKDVKEKDVFTLIQDPNTNIQQQWKNVVNGIPFQGQYFIKNKFNEEIWLRSFFTPVHNMYGEIDRVVMTAYDMTKEKEMELEAIKQKEQLLEQEEKLKQSDVELRKKLKQARAEMQLQLDNIEKVKILHERTLEGMLDAIFIIDKNSEVSFFNQAAENLWEYKNEEIIGKSVSKLFDAETIKKDEFISKLVNPKEPKIVGKRQEVAIKSKSGEEIPVLILISEAKVEDEQTFTVFVQQIEIELF